MWGIRMPNRVGDFLDALVESHLGFVEAKYGKRPDFGRLLSAEEVSPDRYEIKFERGWVTIMEPDTNG